MGPLEGPPSNSEGLGSSAAPGQQHQYSRDAGIGGEGSQNLLPSQYPLGERPPRQSDTRDEAGRTSHDSPSKKSSEQQSRTRGPGQRKPSSSRVCGKCGESLTGQFVRALGDTFHLECFTCFVSTSHFSAGICKLTRRTRIVTRLLLRSFSQSRRPAPTKSHYARRTTFDVWICCASSVVVL